MVMPINEMGRRYRGNTLLDYYNNNPPSNDDIIHRTIQVIHSKIYQFINEDYISAIEMALKHYEERQKLTKAQYNELMLAYIRYEVTIWEI